MTSQRTRKAQFYILSFLALKAKLVQDGEFIQGEVTGEKPRFACIWFLQFGGLNVKISIEMTYATDFVKEKLIEQIAKPATKSKRKVTVVGSGQVGIATVISILAQNVSNEVCIIDANEKLVNAEAKDIQHGSLFLRDAKVIASKDYESSKDSAVCIVTAGARQKEGQTRLDLLKTNVDILSQIVPQLVKYSPKTVIVMITNPCDVLTYAAWKLSGLPVERVFATGTHLDTSRFRYFIAQRLGVSASSVQGYIIGEHGDSSVPVWSGVSVGGVRFSDLNKCIGSEGDTDGWNEIHKQVVKAAYEVIAGKGYTNWAIGLTAASVASMILDNKNEVATVSTLAKEHQCIEQDVFLSLPVVIGANGITSFVNLQLSEMEQKNLCKSAEILDKATKSISEKSAENKKKK
ncbi:L-lactate dehydrogenase-like [Anastrepha ludens]|uniref:L-lactate dehydrogenase-like n=1 Tax=Anastrepha ludens TaxID=28586 RepID=UPI0023AE8D8D|nr:L-lactate dehydrogenase-like [Anastrepha ludens]